MRSQGRSSHGRSPRRRFAQNFLIDRRACRRIVDALDPQADDIVLEIGPGRGALTAELLNRVAPVAAVEVDRDLCEWLTRRFTADRLRLFQEDVLHMDLREVAPRLGGTSLTRVAIVGNLPYNISKPLAMKFVTERAHVDRAVLMFQREVAERITARHGSRRYGAMSVLVGEAYRVEALFDLPAVAFRPRPKVISTVTRWQPRPPEHLSRVAERALRGCLAASFAHRRRTLFNNLRAALPGGERDARDLLERAAVDGKLRPEAVSPREFRQLAALWPVQDHPTDPPTAD